MYQRKREERPETIKKHKPLLYSVSAIMLLILIVIIGDTILLSSDMTTPKKEPHLQNASVASQTIAINGANRWESDKESTAPSFDFSSSVSQKIKVSTIFAQYYHNHGNTKDLGVPLTVAFPVSQGWMQFFEKDALLLPEIQPQYVSGGEDSLAELIEDGAMDPDTGIIRLPLLQTLLTVGSQVSIDANSSPLTYVDLRKAADLDLMLPAPVTGHTATLSPVLEQAIFVKGGMRAGKDVGHLIPKPLWDYINRSDISPDGWEKDFGKPLTEALSFTLTKDGSVHQMLVQAFLQGGLILDQNTQDALGQPEIQRLDTGMAYLRTLGPPPVVMSSQQTIRALGDTTLLDKPSTGHAIAHIGQNFPLIPLGEANWGTGILWYHVQWNVPKRSGSGWVLASSVDFTSSDKAPAWASIDVLSPDLMAYLTTIGNNAGVVIYDVTRHRYYTYNASGQFITASSMKVPIMLAFFDMIEHQGREPDSNEMDLLTTMIENSNNDSASALYYGKLGGAAGVANFLQSIGMTGLTPDPDAWGYSPITPQTMVNLLTRLSEGSILTAYDRGLALNLMRHVEPDQQVGVGDTAPAGATVTMKDGWVPGPDGMWAMNSSGIVTLNKQTYIIAVYTQEQSSLEDGQAIVRHVCNVVASSLI